MDQLVNQRKWIKLFVIFLVFMWICTIISKSIYVSRLPEVKTETPSKRYIEHKVEADGIVTAGASQAINILSGLRVSQIYVQEGDYVEKGDVLFQIDLNDLSELISDKEAELMTTQYKLADLQFNQVLDSQKKEIALLWAKEDYADTDEKTAASVTRAEETLQKAEQELNSHLKTTIPHTSDSERQNAWNSYNNWKQSYYDTQDQKTEKERELTELNAQLEDSDNLSEEEIKAIKENISSLEEEVVSINDELTQLERNTIDKPDYTSEESEYSAWQEKKSSLEDAVHTAKQGLADAQSDRTDALREKLRATATAEVLSPADSTESIYALEISDLEKQLSELYQVQNAKGEVKTNTSGYIMTVQVNVGNRTDDNAAILLADTQKAYQFKASITKEQGEYLHLDDSVELKINGEATMEASVDYLTENNSGGYDVICKLPDGIGKPGINGSLCKTEQGELHSVTVPAEAIYEESKNYYVYVLKERTGILGKEYYVEKIKVTIADKNDKYAAIEEGSIHADMKIVISTTKEIGQGKNVKPVEN